jgi:hypothetical protein
MPLDYSGIDRVPFASSLVGRGVRLFKAVLHTCRRFRNGARAVSVTRLLLLPETKRGARNPSGGLPSAMGRREKARQRGGSGAQMRHGVVFEPPTAIA